MPVELRLSLFAICLLYVGIGAGASYTGATACIDPPTCVQLVVLGFACAVCIPAILFLIAKKWNSLVNDPTPAAILANSGECEWGKLTSTEQLLVAWQKGMLGAFKMALMNLICLADDDNKVKIERGFPDEVLAVHLWQKTWIGESLHTRGLI